MNDLPSGFVYLSKIAPNIQQSARYATENNFLGRRVNGYFAEEIITTTQVAEKLLEAQDFLREGGLELVIYDGYRPQKAVEDFYNWCFEEVDNKAKEQYYPYIDKKTLFDIGFISRRSSHTRGSAVDLTIIDLGKKVSQIREVQTLLTDGSSIIYSDDGTLNMVSSFDIFHEVSYHDTNLVGSEYLKNRIILKDLMMQCGFTPYNKEWWHYSIKNEPFPNDYFDFDIRLWKEN
jgi:D-alanyl-D-alanine dipeptidase